MAEYIVHNIDLSVAPLIRTSPLIESDKPVDNCPNYYIGKVLGGKGNELPLFRKRSGGLEDRVPNYVLRNENGIAVIRIHNKEDFTIYDLPEENVKDVQECVGQPRSSYPYAFMVVDYRDGKCQLAIEKTSAWKSRTKTIKNCLEEYLNREFDSLGINVRILEKSISTKYEEFIDDRLKNHDDAIVSVKFQYVNLVKKPTVRIPEQLTDQMNNFSNQLEVYGAISGTTTMQMGNGTVNTNALKQLSLVVSMCADNAFELETQFRDYGNYKCNENILAIYPMNEIVINNYIDNLTPQQCNAKFDLQSWLDDVFEKIKGGDVNEIIPRKPKKKN